MNDHRWRLLARETTVLYVTYSTVRPLKSPESGPCRLLKEVHIQDTYVFSQRVGVQTFYEVSTETLQGLYGVSTGTLLRLYKDSTENLRCFQVLCLFLRSTYQ